MLEGDVFLLVERVGHEHVLDELRMLDVARVRGEHRHDRLHDVQVRFEERDALRGAVVAIAEARLQFRVGVEAALDEIRRPDVRQLDHRRTIDGPEICRARVHVLRVGPDLVELHAVRVRPPLILLEVDRLDRDHVVVAEAVRHALAAAPAYRIRVGLVDERIHLDQQVGLVDDGRQRPQRVAERVHHQRLRIVGDAVVVREPDLADQRRLLQQHVQEHAVLVRAVVPDRLRRVALHVHRYRDIEFHRIGSVGRGARAIARNSATGAARSRSGASGRHLRGGSSASRRPSRRSSAWSCSRRSRKARRASSPHSCSGCA